MPLNKPVLVSSLTDLFSSPPATYSGCATLWASALGSYTRTIIPVSVTVDVAQTTLASRLTTIFTATDSSTTAVEMENAFRQFAILLGIGMGPQYTATAPTGLIGFSTLFATPESSIGSAVSKVANAVDTWMRTGIATLAFPPATTVNWS